jgi:hypothetical protein
MLAAAFALVSIIISETWFCQSAIAQQQREAAPRSTVSSLIEQGFEIKAANVIPNGYGVFLQKGKAVFQQF